MKKILFILLSISIWANSYSNEEIWEDKDRFKLYEKEGESIGKELDFSQKGIGQVVSNVEKTTNTFINTKRGVAFNYNFKLADIPISETSSESIQMIGMGVEMSIPTRVPNVNYSWAMGFYTLTFEEEVFNDYYWNSYPETKSYSNFGLFIEFSNSLLSPYGIGKKDRNKFYGRWSVSYNYLIDDVESQGIPGIENHIFAFNLGAGISFNQVFFVEGGYEVFLTGEAQGIMEVENPGYGYIKFGFGGV